MGSDVAMIWGESRWSLQCKILIVSLVVAPHIASYAVAESRFIRIEMIAEMSNATYAFL